MDTLIVNILLPTYEPEPTHLSEALESLLAQTETEWTLLICDDASEKDVQRMISKYLDDPRISFIRNDQTLGIGPNWNKCIQKADAPYVQFLFQDDSWETGFLEKSLRVMEANPSVGFASIDHRYSYEGDVPVDGYERLRNFKEKEIQDGLHKGEELLLWWIQNELHPNIIGEPPFVMFRKSLFDEVGPFNEDMVQFLDVEYWIRCLQKSDWYYLKEDLGTFRVHPGAASARNTVSGAGIYDRFHCIENLIHSLPKGNMRDAAITARRRALAGMIWKFLDRIKNRQAVSMKGKGGSTLKKFCLRHPFFTLRAFLTVISEKVKKTFKKK